MKTREKWRDFESDIVTHSKLNRISVIRIPDFVGVSRGGQSYRKKVAFDFAAGVDGIAVFFDAKCGEAESRFNFKSRLINDKKIHQWQALQDCSDTGNIAGLLLWFPLDNVYGWASVPVIRTLLAMGIKEISPTTEGIAWQTDNQPINLRILLSNDLSHLRSTLSHSAT